MSPADEVTEGVKMDAFEPACESVERGRGGRPASSTALASDPQHVPITLDEQARDPIDAESLLRWALERFHPRIALASSFGAEDVVLIDMLCRIEPRVRVFTLDTGRLHEETYALMERIRLRYGIDVEVCFPEREAVEALERTRGLYSFRESLAARKECCRIRKVEPMGRVLGTLDAWITGLRREQAATRDGVRPVEPDPSRPGLLKLNPLAGWSTDDVWDYIRRWDVPYNALHDRGFPSIGCAPCTRAVAPGEDIRAGRWWWESPEHKECGLHKA